MQTVACQVADAAGAALGLTRHASVAAITLRAEQPRRADVSADPTVGCVRQQIRTACFALAQLSLALARSGSASRPRSAGHIAHSAVGCVAHWVHAQARAHHLVVLAVAGHGPARRGGPRSTRAGLSSGARLSSGPEGGAGSRRELRLDRRHRAGDAQEAERDKQQEPESEADHDWILPGHSALVASKILLLTKSVRPWVHSNL